MAQCLLILQFLQLSAGGSVRTGKLVSICSFMYRVRQHNFFFLNSHHSVGWCRSEAPVVSYEMRNYKVKSRHHALEQWGECICRWGLLFERMFRSDVLRFLSESRFGVAGPLSRFDPLWFFSRFFFEIPCLCKPSKNPTRFEDQIQEEIANIAPAMLAGVMTNARNRFTQCMENGGRHLPDVIFKTN